VPRSEKLRLGPPHTRSADRSYTDGRAVVAAAPSAPQIGSAKLLPSVLTFSLIYNLFTEA
jgi:hypothetical protein